MRVPFLDLKAAYLELKDEIDAAVSRVMSSGWYIGGAEVELFEQEFAAYCQAGHAVGVANGLDALVLALKALEIGPGDEVLVPSNTFIATWLAVSQAGATPVPVEPDRASRNMDPALIEMAITPRSRAIIPVHLYGHPADLDPIIALARRHGLAVIEDAAQAHGARYKGRRIGAHGDAVCWSFYPGKNLGALGDGGAVTTDNAALAERIRRLGNYGSTKKYEHVVQGTNSRLDPLQAAILREKLVHLDAWNERRRAVAELYSAALNDSSLRLPSAPSWAEPVWHLFVVESSNRDALQSRLAKAGVGTLIHYPIPPHRQEVYSASHGATTLPIAELLSAQVLSLPVGPHLTAPQQQETIEALAQAAALTRSREQA